MNRPLRKRHLVTWIILSVIILFVLIYGRLKTPEFAGDTPKSEIVL